MPRKAPCRSARDFSQAPDATCGPRPPRGFGFSRGCIRSERSASELLRTPFGRSSLPGSWIRSRNTPVQEVRCGTALSALCSTLGASPGSLSNWIYRTAAQGMNALRAWSSSAASSLIASTVIPPALLLTSLASKPRPLANRTATRCPFHSLDKYPANAPPLSTYDLRASYTPTSWSCRTRPGGCQAPSVADGVCPATGIGVALVVFGRWF